MDAGRRGAPEHHARRPGSQARWEALALTFSVAQWGHEVRSAAAPIHFVGDAQGVLQGITALRARDAGVNLVAMELALRLAPAGLELAATHLWSERNTMCDRLSRLAEGATVPTILAGTQSVELINPVWRILGALRVAPPRRRRQSTS